MWPTVIFIAVAADPEACAWMKASSCRGMDTNIWYLDPGGKPTLAQHMSSSCDVQSKCLEWALASGENQAYGAGRHLCSDATNSLVVCSTCCGQQPHEPAAETSMWIPGGPHR